MKIEEEIKQQNFRSQQQKVAINLLYTSGWLSNKNKEFFKPYKITPQQFNVLRILRGQYPDSISTSSIKERMLDKNSDASRIVDRLTLKKLVDKKTCPNDKRLVDVIITKKGLGLLDQLDICMCDQYKDINLTEEEAQHLNMLLNKMRG